jgi:hypothetical protein
VFHFLERLFQSVPFMLGDVIFSIVIEMKKLLSIILIASVLTMTVLCVSAVSAAEEPVGPGPFNNDGESGNSAFSPGPAPSAGDGESEGPEWDLPV